MEAKENYKLYLNIDTFLSPEEFEGLIFCRYEGDNTEISIR